MKNSRRAGNRRAVREVLESRLSLVATKVIPALLVAVVYEGNGSFNGEMTILVSQRRIRFAKSLPVGIEIEIC
jgi:hypothetical protein